MRRVFIATQHGYRTALCLATTGDWAITIRPGELQSITHLPTGARVCNVEAEADYAALAKALDTLAAVPHFDVQTFDSVKGELEATLRLHGLRPAWRKRPALEVAL